MLIIFDAPSPMPGLETLLGIPFMHQHRQPNESALLTPCHVPLQFCPSNSTILSGVKNSTIFSASTNLWTTCDLDVIPSLLIFKSTESSYSGPFTAPSLPHPPSSIEDATQEEIRNLFQGLVKGKLAGGGRANRNHIASMTIQHKLYGEFFNIDVLHRTPNAAWSTPEALRRLVHLRDNLPI
jgi:hypothetical protein